MLKFQNPACYVLIALFLAHCFNDLLSTPLIGGFPITPVQIVILLSTLYLIIKGGKLNSKRVSKIFTPAYLYLIVIAISTILTFIEHGQFEVYVLTFGFNLMLLRFLAPLLSNGLSATDVKNVVLIFCYLIFLLCVIPGLVEFITRTTLLPTQKGISSNIFYIRGLFTDKIEFGTILGVLIFILVLILESRTSTFGKIIIISLIFISTLLIFFSFSSTAIVGTVSGIVVLFMSRVRGIFFKAFASVLLIFVLYSIIEDTPLFEEQVKSYELKYSLNVDRYDERNFRYLSFVKGFDSFFENPFFGSGVSQSQVVIQQLLGTRKQVNPHNILSTELIDYGLFGTVFMAIFLYRLYKLMTLDYIGCKNEPHLFFLHRLVLALGVLLMFRLTLYYHRFDQTIYFLWIALLIATYGTAIRAAKNWQASHKTA